LEAQNAGLRDGSQKKFEKYVLNHDPSSWFLMIAAWEIIMRADQCMCHLQFDSVTGGGFHDLINATTVHAISPISEAGAPSWGGASELIKTWPQIFSTACDKVLEENPEQTEALGRKRVATYARLSILRAAYFTIIMRAAREPGPGLTVDTRMEIALAYMA